MTANPESQLLLVKWLSARLKPWELAAKAGLSMRQGERTAGVVGDQVIGHVTMAKGRKTAKVVNTEAFLAYVKAHYPTEVEVVEQVRPAFVKKTLDDAVAKGAFVDADGVVVDGIIDVVQGDPYPTTKLTADADIVIAGLLQRGVLGVDGLTAIDPPIIDAEVVE